MQQDGRGIIIFFPRFLRDIVFTSLDNATIISHTEKHNTGCLSSRVRCVTAWENEINFTVLKSYRSCMCSAGLITLLWKGKESCFSVGSICGERCLLGLSHSIYCERNFFLTISLNCTVALCCVEAAGWVPLGATKFKQLFPWYLGKKWILFLTRILQYRKCEPF